MFECKEPDFSASTGTPYDIDTTLRSTGEMKRRMPQDPRLGLSEDEAFVLYMVKLEAYHADLSMGHVCGVPIGFDDVFFPFFSGYVQVPILVITLKQWNDNEILTNLDRLVK